MGLRRILRMAFLGFATAALALFMLPWAAPSAQAFTLENLGAGSTDGSARYADPGQQVKNLGRGTIQFGEGGPIIGPQAPAFGGFMGSGLVAPPEPYARPPGNGD